MFEKINLNDGLVAAGDPDRIADLAAARDAFHETRWVAWNIVRTIATTAAFGCLVCALVIHGRATADHDESFQASTVRPGSARPGHGT